MKRILFLAASVFFGFHAYAQGSLGSVKSAELSFGNNPQTMDYFNNFRTLMEKRAGTAVPHAATIKGSAYYNENFMPGTIISGEKAYNNVQLRYNAYADEVEMKVNASDNTKKEEEIYAMAKTSELSFIINNEKIQYTTFFRNDKKGKSVGNVFVLFEGKTYSLYKRKLKLYKASKKATTSLQRSFPARFVDDEKYYLQTGTQTPVPVKPKLKHIISLLDGSGSDKEALKNYIKEHNIDIKKEEGLIALFSYVDKL